MRKIKFRAWDEEEKRFLYWDPSENSVFITCDDNNLDYSSWYDVMSAGLAEQYTGIHDKNGEEIYEGDIIRWPAGIVTVLNDAVVEWQLEGALGWSKRLLKVDIKCKYFPLNSNDNQEIIGNIHDNPELLKE
jgi:uncharacterized phage protein (TIGR01671 family)